MPWKPDALRRRWVCTYEDKPCDPESRIQVVDDDTMAKLMGGQVTPRDAVNAQTRAGVSAISALPADTFMRVLPDLQSGALPHFKSQIKALDHLINVLQAKVDDFRGTERPNGTEVLIQQAYVSDTGQEQMETLRLPVVPPTWHGSYWYQRVYKTALSQITAELGGSKSSAEYIVADSVRCLGKAHVLVTSPAQVDALPEWGNEEQGYGEMWRWGAEAQLPFDHFWMEFGPAGIPLKPHGLQDTSEKGELTMVGAACWRETAGRESGRIAVQPFLHHPNWGGYTISTGRLVLGYGTDDPDMVHDYGSSLVHPHKDMRFKLATVAASAVENTTGLPGGVILASTDNLLEYENIVQVFESDMMDMPLTTTLVTGSLACRMLYLLMSANVQAAEPNMATLPRPVRRRMEREGGQPSLFVKVRAPRRYKRSSVATGGTRNYTHRFDRIGYYKHVTKGSHVRCGTCKGEGKVALAEDSIDINGIEMPLDDNTIIVTCRDCHGTGLDPEKVKPCIRTFDTGPQAGQPTCPHGCRREWNPPTVVGDESLPYQPKQRIIKGAQLHAALQAAS